MDLEGKQFGRFTVLSFDYSDGKHAYWKCVCCCGKELILSRRTLVQRRRTACSRACSFKNMLGLRFGKFTVVARSKQPTGRSGQFWKCLCDCGNSVVKPTRNLRRGKSCGCEVKLSNNASARNALIRSYIATAKRRGIDFRLSVQQCDRLFAGDCHYCGTFPEQKVRINSSVFTYNGIDRKNSKLHYTARNTVTCCKLCNRRKSGASYKDFISWIDRCAAQSKKRLVPAIPIGTRAATCSATRTL